MTATMDAATDCNDAFCFGHFTVFLFASYNVNRFVQRQLKDMNPTENRATLRRNLILHINNTITGKTKGNIRHRTVFLPTLTDTVSACTEKDRQRQTAHNTHHRRQTTVDGAAGKDRRGGTLGRGSSELGTHPEERSPERGWCRGCSRDWCRDCNLDSCWGGECGSGLACGREEQQEEELYHTGWLSGQQVRWECQYASMEEEVKVKVKVRGEEQKRERLGEVAH